MDYSLRRQLNEQIYLYGTEDPTDPTRATDDRGGVSVTLKRAVDCYIIRETNTFRTARGTNIVTNSKFIADGPENLNLFENSDLVSESGASDAPRYVIGRIAPKYDYLGNLDLYEVYY